MIDSNYPTEAILNNIIDCSSGDILQIFAYSPAPNTVSLTPFDASGSIPAKPSSCLQISQVMYTQVGPTGAQGFQGSQGVTGAQGFQDIRGAGDTGPQGPPGGPVVS